jgi:hypothetical protein
MTHPSPAATGTLPTLANIHFWPRVASHLPGSRTIACDQMHYLASRTWAPGSRWFYAQVTQDWTLKLCGTWSRFAQIVLVRKLECGGYAVMTGSGKGGRILDEQAAKSLLRAVRDDSGKLVPTKDDEGSLNRCWGGAK